MSLKKIEALLEKQIGLCSHAIGLETLEKVAVSRAQACGCPNLTLYNRLLENSAEERENLVESVVVPETWFFRNRKSYAFLGNHVKYEWMNQNEGRLTILSIPCSTGEEPYSIVMELLDKGISTNRFHVDAVDISRHALAKARAGMFGEGSFRCEDLSFRDKYFVKIANIKTDQNFYQIDQTVKNAITFYQGNLMDDRLLIEKRPYDIIFFRNLLIYFSAQAKTKSMGVIKRLLAGNGMLFVGHAERSIINGSNLVWSTTPGVFACRRGESLQQSALSYGFEAPPVEIRSDEQIHYDSPAAVIPPQYPVKDIKHDFTEPASSTADDMRQLEQLLAEAEKLADGGKLNAAFDLCLKCLQLDAFHVQTHFLMGVISHALQDELKAEAYFNKAIYLDPYHYEAINHLAFIMEHRGELTKAERLRRRAFRIMEQLNALD